MPLVVLPACLLVRVLLPPVLCSNAVATEKIGDVPSTLNF